MFGRQKNNNNPAGQAAVIGSGNGQNKVLQILAQGTIISMADDLKDAQNAKTLNLQLIPKNGSEKPAKPSPVISNGAGPAGPVKKEPVNFVSRPLEPVRPDLSLPPGFGQTTTLPVKQAPLEEKPQTEQKTTEPETAEQKTEPEPLPEIDAVNEAASQRKTVFLKKDEIPVFQQKAHQEIFDHLEKLKTFSAKEKPFRDEKKRLLAEEERLEALLNSIRAQEEAINKQLALIEQQEQAASSAAQKHQLEQARWQLEEQRRVVEESKWSQEEEVEKQKMAIAKIESSLAGLKTEQDSIFRLKQEKEDILKSIRLKNEEAGLRRQFEVLQTEEKKALAEKNAWQVKKQGMEAELAKIKDEEQAIEQEEQELSRTEKTVQSAVDRKKIGLERWQIEEKRKQLEQKRWSLENETNSLMENFGQIEGRIQDAKTKKEDCFQKIRRLEAQIKYNVKFSEDGGQPSEGEAAKISAGNGTKQMEERGRARQAAEEELKSRIEQEKRKSDERLGREKAAQERQQRILAIEKRAQAEREGQAEKELSGPLQKSEILRRLTRTSAQEEAQRQEFLARVADPASGAGSRQGFGLAETKFPAPPEKKFLAGQAQSPVIFYQPRKASKAGKIFTRIAIVVLILIAAFGAYLAFSGGLERGVQVSPVFPFLRAKPAASASPEILMPENESPASPVLPETQPPAEQAPLETEFLTGQATSAQPQIPLETEPSTEQPSSPLIKTQNTFVINWNGGEGLAGLFSEALEEKLDSGRFAQIVFAKETGGFWILQEILAGLGVTMPAEILQDIATSTIFLYSGTNDKKIGFVAEVGPDKISGLKNVLRSWESSAEKDTGPFFALMGKQSAALVSYFRSGSYGQISFRYQTFTKQDFGLCYAVFDKYFVFAPSWESLAKIIAELKQ
ncbi:MAG: hypothetical protein M1127_03220 [Patescibacteria group bacterium]|nr:hypothetical protein [Patescibacteria group bacterium]